MRELRAAVSGACAFALVYFLAGALRLPVLTYDPLARTIELTAQRNGLAMRYFGELIGAVVAGSCAGVAMWNSRRPAHPAAPLTVAALVLVGLQVAFHLSRLLAAV